MAQTAKIIGENIVINKAGLASLACSYGGTYLFTHCTFNNDWNSSQQVAVAISNFITGATPEVKDLSAATFNNCIIYGSFANEMSLNKKTGAAFEYQFNNCLIKFDNISNQFSTNLLYQFSTDTAHYNAIVLNKDPKYYNQSQNKFNIDETSAAFAKGNSMYLIPLDVLGNTRTIPPDLGAYQNKTFSK